MLDLMHLKREYLTRYPAQLSGGEQQRVALARALISRPGVLLLDEPMSALDAKLKKSLQAELKKLHRELGTSFVLVTHDLEEAMMLADRICVMRAGEVVQLGAPSDIYYRPANMFVAGFIGETNFLPVAVNRLSDGARVSSPLVEHGDALIVEQQISPNLGAQQTALLVRPETIRFVSGSAEPAEWTLSGDVEEFFIKGASTQYRIRVAGLDKPVVMDLAGSLELPAKVGDSVRIGFHPARSYLISE
jgi:ABC-type Fe3+/spermidine/putrescine transport system ATPase subunit